MADKTLTCKECNVKFIFSDKEQDFYKEKGFVNEPQRCPNCRAAKKQQRRGGAPQSSGFGGGGGGQRGSYGAPKREMYDAVCAECGVETMVPFKPNGEKPVLCKDCYQPKKRY